MDKARVYTPQMVIDGRVELVGSRRSAVLEIIELLKERREGAPELRLTDGGVAVGTGAERGTVWLVGFDQRHEVEIRRGENAGRTLTYHNVVRELRPLGRWQGRPVRFELVRGDRGGTRQTAVLLQADDGRILNALRLAPGS